MKASPSFTIRNVGDVYLILSLCSETFDKHKTLTTNETGAFLWKALQKDCSVDELGCLLQDIYDIEKDTALADIKAFVSSLKKIGACE